VEEPWEARRMRERRVLSILFAMLIALAACSSSEASGDAGNETTEPSTITVFAAASLTDAFGEIGEAFSEANENVEVEFNFLASSDLATQIIEGAPADAFASADEANLDKVVAEELATDPVVFVENRLSIAVQQGNPKSIAALEDLENEDLVVALCNEECPAGRYALEIFESAGVTVEPDSLEADVRGVLTRVGLGEADAGLVYVTDIEADPEVEGVDIPEDVNVIATYPIAPIEGAPQAASDFVEFVLSEAGQRILSDYGFQIP
jgi:molybdate transport system substrate-binding protein